MDFAPSPRAADLAARVRTFVKAEVEPVETRVLRDVAGARRRAAPDGVHAELLPQLAAAVGVAHAVATSASRFASTSANSCRNDLANFSTPSRSSVSVTSS